MQKIILKKKYNTNNKKNWFLKKLQSIVELIGPTEMEIKTSGIKNVHKITPL